MDRRLIRGLVLASVVAVAGLALLGTAAASEKPKSALKAFAVLRDNSSNVVGRVYFFQRGDALSVVATAAWLAPGFHGFHVHAIGACDGGSAFASAGGHQNPHGEPHGRHAGDMPPLLAGADGTAWSSFRTDRFLDEHVFDADGSAIVVHAGPDNLGHVPGRYRTDAGVGPDAATLATGDAGGRVACGVIRRAKT